MTTLEIDTEEDADAVRLVLRGELDIASAPRVEEELEKLEQKSPATLAIDLRELEFMDSTGLRVIVAADARAREQSRRLVVVQGPDAVHRIFRVTRLDERLDIVEDPASLHGVQP